jgi:hypothetical protein
MPDSRVVEITVKTSTADYKNAGTDDEIKLHLLNKQNIIVDTITLDNPDKNDFEPGSQGTYSKLLEGYILWENLGGFRLQIYGHNAWMPRAILIELKLLSTSESKIAAYYQNFGFWLSQDTGDADGGLASPSWDIPITNFNALGLAEESPAPVPSPMT